MSIYADNRKAYFNYEIVEKYEAGLELQGGEVKSIKDGRAILTGSFCIIRGGEVFITGMQIPPFQVKNTSDGYDPLRVRKLLLNKKEIRELEGMGENKRLTIIPLSLYSKGRKVKLEIAIARGKQMHDKRETIKKRDIDRDVGREFRDR